MKTTTQRRRSLGMQWRQHFWPYSPLLAYMHDVTRACMRVRTHNLDTLFMTAVKVILLLPFCRRGREATITAACSGPHLCAYVGLFGCTHCPLKLAYRIFQDHLNPHFQWQTRGLYYRPARVCLAITYSFSYLKETWLWIPHGWPAPVFNCLRTANYRESQFASLSFSMFCRFTRVRYCFLFFMHCRVILHCPLALHL